jgi:hypothetical protein
MLNARRFHSGFTAINNQLQVVTTYNKSRFLDQFRQSLHDQWKSLFTECDERLLNFLNTLF